MTPTNLTSIFYYRSRFFVERDTPSFWVRGTELDFFPCHFCRELTLCFCLLGHASVAGWYSLITALCGWDRDSAGEHIGEIVRVVLKIPHQRIICILCGYLSHIKGKGFGPFRVVFRHPTKLYPRKHLLGTGLAATLFKKVSSLVS